MRDDRQSRHIMTGEPPHDRHRPPQDPAPGGRHARAAGLRRPRVRPDGATRPGRGERGRRGRRHPRARGLRRKSSPMASAGRGTSRCATTATSSWRCASPRRTAASWRCATRTATAPSIRACTSASTPARASRSTTAFSTPRATRRSTAMRCRRTIGARWPGGDGRRGLSGAAQPCLQGHCHR